MTEVETMKSTRNNVLIGLGWAIFHSHIQFNVLISEGNSITSFWVLAMILVSILASALLESVETSLKTWIASIIVSIVLTVILIASPSFIGLLDQQLVSVMISGSIQPIVTMLILTAPIDLLGCFLGQVVRNRFS